jgi:hypothetical protein
MAATPGYVPDGEQLLAFQQSGTFARALVGPAYAGRKTACVHEIIRRATERRYARQRMWPGW